MPALRAAERDADPEVRRLAGEALQAIEGGLAAARIGTTGLAACDDRYLSVLAYAAALYRDRHGGLYPDTREALLALVNFRCDFLYEGRGAVCGQRLCQHHHLPVSQTDVAQPPGWYRDE